MSAPSVTPSTLPPLSEASERVKVLLPLPLGGALDYLLPPGMACPAPGTLVSVPFGRQIAEGVIWETGASDSASVPLEKLKSLGAIIGTVPPLPAVTRAFVDWVAAYTVTPPGAVLKMALGGTLRLPKAKDSFVFPQPHPTHTRVHLTPDQQQAGDHLTQAVQAAHFSVTLLDGVTGSGKTEVYGEAIAAALATGKQVLVLLPEIAMTAALIGRLEKRFGAAPVVWHSSQSEKQKRLAWNGIARGTARFVLGARSALFLPYADLGLIVVDEEHEAAYKQEEGVIYHGRDMAVVRGHLGDIPVVLASATPSLETWHNVARHKYAHIVLPSRYGKAAMPHIKLVDLRQEKMSSQSFISAPLFDALKVALEEGQQAMLFLNRRGYAPLTLCRACGTRLQCPHCTSWLIEHKTTGRLHCHHCGYSLKTPSACPTCHEEDRLAACGPGIERIAEEIAARLPEARTAIMASDTMEGPKAAEELVRQMENQELDLLIGTQIMAKGYHFPRLTLVGVIDGDLGLSGGDPRAAEHTFQLLQQVAGRAGRAKDPGTVLLQTTQPQHPVMQALLKGDRDAFMKAEMAERRTYHLPPFARLASLTLSGRDPEAVKEMAYKLLRSAPRIEGLGLLGPTPPPFAILRGRARQRILVTAPRSLPLPTILKDWLAAVPCPRTIKIQTDVDPYSFL